jgi:hypothetical protein
VQANRSRVGFDHHAHVKTVRSGIGSDQ